MYFAYIFSDYNSSIQNLVPLGTNFPINAIQMQSFTVSKELIRFASGIPSDFFQKKFDQAICTVRNNDFE